MDFNLIPDVLLLRIMGFLNFKDLKKISESSSRLYVLATTPSLWSRFHISANRVLSDSEKFSKLRRFQTLLKLDLRTQGNISVTPQNLSSLFSYLTRNNQITSVMFSNLDLSSIPGFPFSKALGHLSAISLRNCNISSEQIIALLSALVKTGKPMSSLDLSFNSLQFVPSDLLNSTLNHVQNLDLSLTDLPADHVAALLNNVKSGVAVERLNLSDLNLENTDPDVFGKAVSNLKSVKLSNCVMNDEQKRSLIQCLADSNCCLREELDLSGVSLSGLEPKILSRGLSHIRNLDLGNCWLSYNQMSALTLSLEDSLVEHLNLAGNDCQDLDAEKLLVLTNQLKSIDLSSTRLKKEVLLEYLEVQGLEDGCRVKLSNSDFLSVNFRSRIKSYPTIDLKKEDLPFYVDENSCGYVDPVEMFESR